MDEPATMRWRVMAGVLLAALLLILALRMNQSETLREPLSQKYARAAAAREGKAGDSLTSAKETGPAVIAGQCVLVLLIAGAAAGIGAAHGALSRVRVAQGGIIVAILLCGLVSSLRAENRFSAIIGLTDIATALAGGWTVALLCAVLGDTARRAVVAAVVAVAAIWITKALMQKYVEFPDIAEFLRQNPRELLRATGIDDPVQMKLYQARMNSREVFGFISFANVFAAGLVGMLGLLTAVLTGWLRRGGWGEARAAADVDAASPAKSPAKPRAVAARAGRKGEGEIPIDRLCFFAALAVLAAGLCVLPMTHSMGGMAMGYATVAAIALGGFFYEKVVARRRALVVLALAGLVIGAAGVVAYGVRNDRLPSKSLMFRWHYWTASVPMIAQSPAWGVGLNNFGDYYLEHKRPSSPEDVKDPHSLVVRLAAEMGMPATLFFLALLAWMVRQGLNRRGGESYATTVDSGRQNRSPLMWGGIAGAGVWVVAHLLLAEVIIDFNIYMTIFYGLVGGAAFATAVVLTRPAAEQNAAGVAGINLRYVLVAGLIAALAMGAYDLINMALLTGPVAMLFWMLVGAAASYEAPVEPAQRRAPRGWMSPVAAALPVAGAAAVAVLVWGPMVMATLPWDPTPLENAYVEHMAAGDYVKARAALDGALQRAPRRLDLVSQKAQLLREHFPAEPVAPLLRRLFELDRANAQIRARYALADSDLPGDERARYLQQALDFDAALADDEAKRLTPETRGEIARTLARLRAGTQTAPR